MTLNPGSTEPPDDPAETHSEQSRARHTLRYALGLGVAAGAIWLVVSAAGGMGDAIDALRHTNGAWIAPAFGFEVLAYLFASVRFRRLAGPTAGLSLAESTEITLVAHGLGVLAPAAPAEGIAFQHRELSHRGLTRRRSGLTIAFEQWFSTRAFYLVHAINLLVIVSTRDFPTDARWPIFAALVILSLLVLTAMAAARPQVAERIALIGGFLRFWKPRPSVTDRRSAGARLHAEAMTVVGPPRSRVRLALTSAGAVLADALGLWMLLEAVGIHVGFELALLAAATAAAASSIPLLPGGLGAVEAAVPALLAWYGAPVAAALSATLLYRAIGTFLPAAGGAISLPIFRGRTGGPDAPGCSTRSGIGSKWKDAPDD